MQIVIDIPQEVYDKALSGDGTGTIWAGYVKNGIPLDKIRAEVEQITDTMGVSYNQYVSKIDVLQIIDKYKAESEVEE